MAWWLRCWITIFWFPGSNLLGGAKVDSAFHSSEVDKMITRNSWELGGEN